MNNLFDKCSPYFNLVSRILLAFIFIMAGYSKIGGYAGTQAYMESTGVPGMLLPLVIMTELGGGLLLLVGFQARLVSFLLAGFTLLSAIVFHYQPADETGVQMIMLMKNLAIAGGLLLITQYGAGAFAIDKRQ